MMNSHLVVGHDRLEASRRRLGLAQARCQSLGDYADALLTHVNEAAAALRDPGDPPRGRVFRVGLAFVTEDGLVVPVPFRRSAPSLFIDQFHVLPLRATSLGPLLESGRGDRIDDLESHLAARALSISTQAALREGIRSNVRLPWRSLDRRGFLWFSADTPRFFDDALFAHLENLVPDVELQLRLLDALEPVLATGLAQPVSMAQSRRALGSLSRLLEGEENPFPHRLELAWSPTPVAPGACLVNLWRLGPDLALLVAMECSTHETSSMRRLLVLRGLLLQQAGRVRNPARIVEEVESRLAAISPEDPTDIEDGWLNALTLAVLHLELGHADIATVGEPRLWLDGGSGIQQLPADPRPLGKAKERSADSRPLPPSSRLLLTQGRGTPTEKSACCRLSLRIRASLLPRTHP